MEVRRSGSQSRQVAFLPARNSGVSSAPEPCAHIFGRSCGWPISPGSIPKVGSRAHRERHGRLRSLVEQHFERLCADAHGCAILRAALTEGQVEDRRRLTKLLLAQPALLSSMKCKRQGEEALRRLRQVLEESDEVPDARGAHASRAA